MTQLMSQTLSLKQSYPDPGNDNRSLATEFRIPPTCSISILLLYLISRLILIMSPPSSTYLPASCSAVDYLTICCWIFKTPTGTQTGHPRTNIGEKWLRTLANHGLHLSLLLLLLPLLIQEVLQKKWLFL